MRRIIGIDPGTQVMGYAIVRSDDDLYFYLEDSGVFKAPSSKKLQQRCYDILSSLHKKIDQYRNGMDIAITESGFVGKDPRSSLVVGEIRGMVKAVFWMNHLAYEEVHPLTAKKAATGSGKAKKDAVALYIKSILKVKKAIRYEDETDAMALVLWYLNKKKLQIA